MSEKKVNVTFALQNTQFNKNINEMNRQIRLCEQQVKTAGQQMLAFGQKAQGLAEKQRALATAIKSAETNINNYKNRISGLQSTMEKNISKTEELKSKKQALSKEYKDSAKSLGEEDEKTKQLKKQLEEVTRQYEEYNNRVKSNAESINKSTTAMESQKAKLESLKAQFQQVNKELLENSNNLLNWSAKLKSASDKLTSFGQGTDKLGSTLLKLSAPLLAFSAYAIKSGVDFQASMSKVKGVSGESSEQIQKLSDRAKELGKDIKGASAKEVADSYSYLAVSGQKSKQMLESIEPNVKASIAFGQDMATSTSQVVDSMGALGLKAKETQEYLDVLTKTQNNSNTTADQLEQAYIGCGNTLHQFNVPLKESSTILGIMANQGLKGSEAGNSMNSIFVNLLGTTKKTSNAMKILGVDVFDSKGKFVGLEESLSRIKNGMKGMTEEQKSTLEAALGGKTQLSALQAMLNATGDSYTSLNGKVNNCSGSLEKMYKTMTNNTKGSWTELKDEAESVGLKLADDLLPVCDDLIAKVKEILEWWENLSPASRQIITDLGLMTAATGGLLKVVGKVSTGLGTLTGTVGKIAEHFGKAEVAAETATSAVEGVGVATEGATAGAIGLSGVILPLVGIMGTLAIGVYTYAKYQDVCNQSVTKSRESMSLSERAVAKLTGTVTYSQKQLENWNIVAKKLPDTLSGSFKKAFQSAKEDIADFNLKVAQINFDKVMNNDEATSLEKRIDKAINGANDSINSHYAEIQASLQQTFTLNGTVDSGEKELIDFYNKQKDKSLQKVSENQKAINDLMHKVTQQGYQLTSDDIAAIEKYYADIKQEELKAKTKSKEDSQYAQGDYIKENSSSMTSKEATKELSKLKKETNTTNKSLENEMNSSINNILQGYSSMSSEEKKQAQKSVAETRSYYNNKIKANDDYYNKTYTAVVNGNNKLSKVIDVYTGKNFSKESATLNKEFNDTKKHYKGLDDITKSGWTKLYNTKTKSWDSVYVQYDKHNKKVTGIAKGTVTKQGLYVDESCGYDDKKKKSLDSVISKTQNKANKVMSALNAEAGTTVNKNGEIINSHGKVVGKLDEVKKKADGTKEGLIKLAGKEYKINVNSKGAVTACDEIEKKKINDKEFKITGFVKIAKFANDVIGNAFGFAEGGTVNKDGVYNFNEKGIELADSITSRAYGAYQQAYLPSYTQVTNALMTTAKLKEMVNMETKTQNKELYNAITALIATMEKKDSTSNDKDINIKMYNAHFENKNSESANVNNVKRIIKSMY